MTQWHILDASTYQRRLAHIDHATFIGGWRVILLEHERRGSAPQRVNDESPSRGDGSCGREGALRKRVVHDDRSSARAAPGEKERVERRAASRSCVCAGAWSPTLRQRLSTRHAPLDDQTVYRVHLVMTRWRSGAPRLLLSTSMNMSPSGLRVSRNFRETSRRGLVCSRSATETMPTKRRAPVASSSATTGRCRTLRAFIMSTASWRVSRGPTQTTRSEGVMISVTAVVAMGYRALAVARMNLSRSRSVVMPAISSRAFSTTMSAPTRCASICSSASATVAVVSIVQIGACARRYSFSLSPVIQPRFRARIDSIVSFAVSDAATDVSSRPSIVDNTEGPGSRRARRCFFGDSAMRQHSGEAGRLRS
mmetsp:Transcript_22705/g.90081  ORF Transcript_22705/g.90081 Transcript_22705/m.90081 type:complete len:366 (-) Transcript_22705:113-1210(-)